MTVMAAVPIRSRRRSPLNRPRHALRAPRDRTPSLVRFCARGAPTCPIYRHGSSTSPTPTPTTASSRAGRRPRSTSSSVSATTVERCLIARKRYLPRHVTQKGQLEAMGVQRSSAFRHDVQYREGRQFRKSRDRRAIDRMSTYGKKLLQDRWTGTEHEVMSTLWHAGVSVPYPIAFADDVFDLEYVGDWEWPRRSCLLPDCGRATRRRIRTTPRRVASDHRGGDRPWRPVGLQPAVVAGTVVVHRLPAVDRHRRQPPGCRLPPSRRAQRVRLVHTSWARRRRRGGVCRPPELPLTSM